MENEKKNIFVYFKDAYAGVFLTFVSVIYLISIRYIKQTQAVGPKTLPLFLGIALLLLSLGLVFKGLSEGIKKSRERGEIESVRPHYFRVLLTLLNIALFAALLKPLGYCVSSFIFLMIQMPMLQGKDKLSKRILGVTALISLITSLILTLLFVQVFKVALPVGITPFLY